MVKQHQSHRLAKALSERRTHFKMYKAGKSVVYAGITVIAFLTGGFLTQQHHVQASTSDTVQTVTATPTVAASDAATDATSATENDNSSGTADTPTADTAQTASNDQANTTLANASTSNDSDAAPITAENTTTPGATTQSATTDPASQQPTVESTATEQASTTSETSTSSTTPAAASSTAATQPTTTLVTSDSVTAQPAATTASQARAATALTLTPIANLTADQIKVLQNGLTYTTRDGSVLNYYYGAPTGDFNRGSTVTKVTKTTRIADVANVWLVKDGVKKGYIYTNGSGDDAELIVYTNNSTLSKISYSYNSGLTVTAFGYSGNTYAIQGTYTVNGLNLGVLYTMQPNADGTGITVSQTLTNNGASFSAVGIGRFVDTEVGTQDNIPIQYIGNNSGLYVQSGTTSSDYRLNIYFNIENGPTMWTALQTQQLKNTAFYTTFNKTGEENANGAPGAKADPGNLDTGFMMKTPVPGGTWASGASVTMSYTTGLVAANVGTLTQEYKTTTGSTIKDSNTVSGFVKDPVTGAATVDQTFTSGNTTYQLVSVTKPDGTVASDAASIAAALAASYSYTDAPQTIIYTYQAITKAPVSTVSSATITYGQATPTFSLTYGTGLATASLTQADFAFAQGGTALTAAPTNAGTYTVTLTAAGQTKVQTGNPNNSFDGTSFLAGTYTINPQATDPTSQTDVIKTNDQTITFGDATPTFTVTTGSNLTAGTLTNADFIFAGSSTVPTAAGSYSVTLSATAQAKIIAANPNYVLTAANFIAGTYIIKPKAADPTEATETVKTADQTITFGDATPTFTVITGSNLTGVTLTNNDFTFNGAATIPTAAGSYQVNLNAAAQQRVADVNPNYVLTSANFIAGTYTIKPKTADPSKTTDIVTTNDQTITFGDATPTFTVTTGSNLAEVALTNADFTFNGSATIPTAAGSYTVTLNTAAQKRITDANPNYLLTDANFIAGTFLITPKAADPAKDTDIVTTDDQTITFGDETPTFTVTTGTNLVSVDLTNADFTFNGSSTIPTAAGQYKVNLNADAQKRVADANPNYVLSEDNFVAGKFTINPKAADPAKSTDIVTTDDKTITFGDATPTFTVTIGNNLNDVTLTNVDFTFDGSSTIPTAAGNYKVNLNADAQKRVADANPNYALSAANFIAGEYTINPKAADPAKETDIVTTDDQTITFGEETPTFTVTTGTNLVSVDLTNADFTFNGSSTIPTAAGQYKVNLNANAQKRVADANPNYVLSEDNFVAGEYTINPKAADPTKDTDIVTTDDKTITFGDATPAFTVTLGNNLNGVTLTNDDFSFDGVQAVPTAAGSYTINLNAEAQQRIADANPNYVLNEDNFIAGKFTINPKNADPAQASDIVTTDNKTITFGDTIPTFTVTLGSNLTGVDLTNADFTFDGSSTIPTAAGSYQINLNADAQQRIADANPNYVLTEDNFIAGKFTIKPKTADPTQDTDIVTTDNKTITFGDATPTFTVTLGSNLVGVDLTNADFTFDGSSTIPTAAGSYQINLNADAQQRITDANPNYVLSEANFIAGTFMINPKPADPTQDTDIVTTDDKTITFGDDTPNFTVTLGSNLNGVALTNTDFVFDGSSTIPTAAGSYEVNLNADAQQRIEDANSNYVLSTANFIAGTFAINPKAADPTQDTDIVTTDDKTITFGDATPTFTVMLGSNLVGVDLTNADFTFDGSSTIPTSAGHYTVNLNADAQKRVADANPNYVLTNDNFVAGNFVINPKTADPAEDTDIVTTDGKTITFGDPTPTFTVTIGSNLTGATLANDDFTFNGSDSIPTAAGSYEVNLNGDAQQRIADANPNYVLTNDNFVAGNFVINPKTADPAEDTDIVTTDDKTITFGDDTPIFTVTLGSNLVGVDLTNSDFTFDGSSRIPTAAGSYKINLNTDAQKRFADANPNYVLTSANFITGTFTIDPKSADPTQGTDIVTTDNKTITFGDDTPSFTVTLGSNLVGVDLTNSDFTFEGSSTIPTAAGSYEINLNSDAQKRIADANPNYVLTTANFIAGTFIINPKTADPAQVTDIVSTDDKTITFGDDTPSFTVTLGSNLVGVDLTNADFTFDGSSTILAAAGHYSITLNGDAQKRVADANPNYVLSAANFIAGTYTINPKAADPAKDTDIVTTDDQTITFGDDTPTFMVTTGSNLNDVTLTNADFTFDGSATIPTDAGQYKINLNADAQKRVADANPNYVLTAANFIAGNYLIKPKIADPAQDADIITTNDQLITFGDATPTFTVTTGSDLNEITLTNDDFTFDGSATIPTVAGQYKVNLNEDAQKRIEEANPNYVLTKDNFIAGTYTIKPQPADPTSVALHITLPYRVGYLGSALPDFTPTVGASLQLPDEPLEVGDFAFSLDGVAADPTTSGLYIVTLSEDGLAKLQAANPNYLLSRTNITEGQYLLYATAPSVSPEDYYTRETVPDPDGGTTELTKNGEGTLTAIDKYWPDGDHTHLTIEPDTDVITATENPAGQPTLPPITVALGETVKTGKTTVGNALPDDGINLTHDGTGTSGDPATGTTGESITPTGEISYWKNAPAVSVTPEDYYVTTTTPDPNGGTTDVTKNGNDVVTVITKHWPDGDTTTLTVDPGTNVITVVETPNGEPALPPVTVDPGEQVTVGKTTINNGRPTGSIDISHRGIGTGTVGESVAPDGSLSYWAVDDPVSVTPDQYYDHEGEKETTPGAPSTRTSSRESQPSTRLAPTGMRRSVAKPTVTKLPQTGDATRSDLSWLGIAFVSLMSLFGWAGRKRKHEDLR